MTITRSGWRGARHEPIERYQYNRTGEDDGDAHLKRQVMGREVVVAVTDGRLVHLDGLNLSRAWMLEGIAAGLPTKDPRVPRLIAAARRRWQAGLVAVTAKHYEGGHWLESFAVYLVTKRGH
jgi:hypothetical protein